MAKKEMAKAKAKTKATTKATADKKSGKAIDALAKARAARAADKGKAKKTAAKQKTKTYTWKAPETLTTGFPLEVTFKTEKDGMPGAAWRVLRFKGRYNPDADPRNIFNMAETDPKTMLALACRMSQTLFHPTGRLNSKGISPRLEPNTVYRVLMRVGRRKSDDVITVTMQQVYKSKTLKSGKTKMVELDKKDPDVRKIKKCKRHLPPVFRTLEALPDRKKRRRKSEEDED